MAAEPTPNRYNTKLFLVRLWSEPGAGESEQLCGRVQQVVSGEAHTFRGERALLALLAAMLRGWDGEAMIGDIDQAGITPRVEKEGEL